MHKAVNRCAFVLAAGFDLNNAFTGLKHQFRIVRHHGFRQRQHFLLMQHRLTVMQRKGHAFGFQQGARQFGHALFQCVLHLCFDIGR
ncbi:hypothetical protein D3C80_1797590 [compost metagenome]